MTTVAPLNNMINVSSSSSSSSSSDTISTITSSANYSSPELSSELIVDCSTDLEPEFEKLNCDNENYYSKECNKFLLRKELVERSCLDEHPKEHPYLYPELDDRNFNIKIAEKKEFNDTKYDGTIHEDIEKYADLLSNVDYELQPHQSFVKNFMSFQTPYNSLLLYHGLGSGKTCSAIGVCEEMRDYMKQMGVTKRIIIVASENVQDNFRLQLFDERKLKLVDGLWTIQACTGNKLLKEINPMNMKGMSKERVISQIRSIINSYYIFLGYGQFANYIIKTMNYNEEEERKREPIKEGREKTKIQMAKSEKILLNKRIMRRLQNEFNNRLIVIDEIHNIRKSDDNENKKVALNLELLVQSAQNMRFVLLSATPMYNNYKEIIWLLNLMNINDRRGKIEVRDVFDKYGNFKPKGKELLVRKATGYVSFVRGENPYTFPYRVYPNEFAKKDTFPFIPYPSYQMNLKKIKEQDKKRILSLYLTKLNQCENCGECQGCAYKYVIQMLRNKRNVNITKTGDIRNMPTFANMESFGYYTLQIPIETLIIAYPMPGLKELLENIPREKYNEEYSPSFSDMEEQDTIESSKEESEKDSGQSLSSQQLPPLLNETYKAEFDRSKELTGKEGLSRMMQFVDTKSPPEKGGFEYKKTTIEQYGRIFSLEQIGKYSAKIKSVLDKIYNPETGFVSEGILLIYSQYIDSGLIPMALALEEIGFTRFGQNVKPLFKNKPTETVDVRTMKPPTSKTDFFPAKYSMITGDLRLSPNNDFEVKGLTGLENKDGHKVKVVLISKAGAEGIDFKFIRQVHILEPWYNMNRTEQIIGRAVRNLSHKDLPFEKRNVEIYMYGTILTPDNKEEAADLYIYRVAEYKAIQIGKVSRVLKETAVDCILNHGQTNFTQEKINNMIKHQVRQVLSTGIVLNNYKVGDAPFSPTCDYMETCDYSCTPDKQINEDNLNEDTYNETFIVMNSEKILQRIRMLMKESYFYKKDVLISAIQTPKKYPYVQIYSALTQLIEDNNEFISDRYGRSGRLINIGDYYLFQPIELKDKNISIFDRMVPIDYKHESIQFEMSKKIDNKTNRMQNTVGIEEIRPDFVLEGKRVLDELKRNFNIVMQFTKETKVPRGDDEWYKYCGIVIHKIRNDYPEITEAKLLEFLVAHMVEMLLFLEKIELIKYLYSLKSVDKTSLEWHIKEYFYRNTIVTKNFNAILLYNLNKRTFIILNKDNIWVEAQPEDEREIATSKEAQYLFEALDIKKYSKIVGFIGYEKKNKYMVFKTKNMESTRDTGARCDEAGKSKTLALLNEIVGENRYTTENTKLKKNKDGTIVHEAMNQLELCVLQEFILRHYNDIQKNGKKWFLLPEFAIYYKLYKVIV